MAISYVSQSSKSHNSTGTANNLTAPAGIQNGDLLLIFFTEDTRTTRWSLQSGFTYLIGTGFTDSLGAIEEASNAMLQCQWRIANGEPSTYTIACPTSPTGTTGMLVFRGVDQTTPIHAAGAISSASGTSHTSQSITVSVADAALAGVWAADCTASASWSSASMTERWDVQDATSFDGSAAYAELLSGTPGALTRTATLSVTNTAASILVALNPATVSADHPWPAPIVVPGYPYYMEV